MTNYGAAIPELIAGRYRVIRRLGGGAMGEVFEVVHPTLPRHEAMKLLSPALSADPNFKRRFLREADVMATLVHQNIVTVFDRGEDSAGRMWLTMELVDGFDAAHLLLDQGEIPVALAIEVIAGAAAALDFAWRTGCITHRDVKPANILVQLDNAGSAETVKLADFGVAKVRNGVTKLTATGITIGTLAYMAPEALEGHELDSMVDQYSLGCTAFALLTGRPPFEASTAAAIISGHLNGPVPPVTSRRLDLPPSLDKVFLRVLSKEPGERYGTCAEFVENLRSAFHQTPFTVAPTHLAATFTGSSAEDAALATAPAAAFAPTAVRPPTVRAQPRAEAPAASESVVAPNRKRMIAAGATAIAFLIGAVAYVAWPSSDSATEGATPSAATTGSPGSAETAVDSLPESAQSAAERIKAAIPEVRELIKISEDNDPNNLIGRPTGYDAATVLVDSRVRCSPPDDIGVDCGATIEGWPDHAAAQRRADYIQSVRSDFQLVGSEWTTVKGNLLLRVSGDLKPSEAEPYRAAFSG